MKKIIGLVFVIGAFIFSGCSNEPVAPKKSEIKTVQKSSAVVSKGKSGKVLYENHCHKTKMRFSSVSDAIVYMAENKLCKGLDTKGEKRVAKYLSGMCKSDKCGSGKCGAPAKCGGVKKCASGKCGGTKSAKPMKCGGKKCGS